MALGPARKGRGGRRHSRELEAFSTELSMEPRSGWTCPGKFRDLWKRSRTVDKTGGLVHVERHQQSQTRLSSVIQQAGLPTESFPSGVIRPDARGGRSERGRSLHLPVADSVRVHKVSDYRDPSPETRRWKGPTLARRRTRGLPHRKGVPGGKVLCGGKYSEVSYAPAQRARSTRRTNSATDATPIFSITRARCTFTVFSVLPSW